MSAIPDSFFLHSSQKIDVGADPLSTFFDAIPLPLLQCNSLGCPTRWNSAFAALLGTARDTGDVETNKNACLKIREVLPTLESVCTETLLSEIELCTQIRIGANDTVKVLEINCSRWSPGEGKTDHVIVTFRDITSDQQLAAQLQKVREEIIQFKYHVSHDLSAPIASARGLLGLVEDDLLSGSLDEVPEMIEETNAQLTRLENLIDDLMSLARADGEERKPTTTDLRELVDEIVASISLHSRELEVSVTLSYDSPTLLTDRVRLRQILANLISNARKFRDPDETAPFVHVNVANEVDQWRVSVSDNGIGMSPKTAEHAFDMFTRGTSTHPGHGLGLHIVLKHVDGLGGRVRVSSIAKPTVIEVVLPKLPCARH